MVSEPRRIALQLAEYLRMEPQASQMMWSSAPDVNWTGLQLAQLIEIESPMAEEYVNWIWRVAARFVRLGTRFTDRTGLDEAHAAIWGLGCALTEALASTRRRLDDSPSTIEVVDSLFIKSNGHTVCVVWPVRVDDPEWPDGKPDVEATQARAKFVADALRNYETPREVKSS